MSSAAIAILENIERVAKKIERKINDDVSFKKNRKYADLFQHLDNLIEEAKAEIWGRN